MKEQVATSLHLLAALIGIPGLGIIFSSVRVLGRGVLSPVGRVAVIICVLVGLGMFGFALYLLMLSSNLPAK